ncbi:ferritin-like domain-containing protein [Lichenifustis flavocetrariae]|uniref:Ferritin-like domain-containing protein n=1 Tax=Lichenifustis flavocetrariae TaxID=2949735 RepID=A0AA41Z0G8_9HYPH|nr:ferritin-like domain-containing protein [Lichenifustis flavocetrariae]MCW6511939.1 ferritin-like domain-containing protein [Lichenifustis flavocetrariae]
MTNLNSKLWQDKPAAETAPVRIDLEAGRRTFIQALGLGVAGAAFFGSNSVKPASAQSVTDADIFNFALNLEYLEAEFYLRASTGEGLTDMEVSGTGTLGPVSGGRQVQFDSQAVANYANEIARNERAHVQTIRSVLGSVAVARPSIDLGLAFTLAARAAGLAGPNDAFDAFANEDNFLLAAFIFEDVGVTAYHGAAPLISDTTNRSYAAGILAVEAYHAGTIRTILYGKGLFSQAQAISNARDSLDGPTDLDQGIGDAMTSNLVPVDSSGLAFSRTTSQVLNIVYLNPNGTPTGFFPNGLNGLIR